MKSLSLEFDGKWWKVMKKKMMKSDEEKNDEKWWKMMKNYVVCSVTWV